MSGPHRPAQPTPAPSRDGVTDLVRWAAFSCFLVPVALLWYGTPSPARPAPPWGWPPSPVCAACCCGAPSASPRTRTAGSARDGAAAGAGPRGPFAGADGTLGKTHRSTDRFLRTVPLLFSQLPGVAHLPPSPPPNPRSTCTERLSGTPGTLRGLATDTRRTSLGRPRVQRFVIDWFTPSCHVDNVPSAEPAIPARRDPVDSILTVYGGGLVQDRGETCWSDRPEG